MSIAIIGKLKEIEARLEAQEKAMKAALELIDKLLKEKRPPGRPRKTDDR
jgi:hypothetical protein